MPTRLHSKSILMVLLVIVTLGCSSAVQPGGSTPQDVAEKAKRAMEADDRAASMQCLHPDDRCYMTYMMAMTSGLMLQLGAMQPDATGSTTELKAVLDEYQVTPPDNPMEAMAQGQGKFELERAKKMYGHVDHPAFLVRVSEAMEKMGNGAPKKDPTEAFQTSVTDIQIDGDRATGKANDQTVHFMKHEGRWFLIFPEWR